MQLSTAKATREKVSSIGQERGKLSRIQGTRCPYRTLVKADPPKKGHKFDPEVWLSSRHNLTGASRSLSGVTYAWKKVRMLQKFPGKSLVGMISLFMPR